MPKIRQYDAGVQTQGPLDTQRAQAQDFGDYRGLSQVGQGLEAVADFTQKRREQVDVSTLSAQLSKARLDWSTNLQERLKSADPNDTEFVANYQKELDDYMTELSANAKTDKGSVYFTEQAGQLRTNLLSSAIAGASELAGVKAKQDWTNSVQANAGAIFNDPSQFEAVMASQKAATQTLVDTGAMSSATALELETKANKEFAKNTIKGMANLNPDAAEEMLKSGKYDPYIGEMKDQLMGEIRQAKTGQRLEAERIKKQEEEALKTEQMATQNTFLKQMNDGKLTPKMILNSNLNPFGSGGKEQMMQLLAANNKERKTRTDPQVFNNLFARINLPEDDPKKLIDENDLNAYVINDQLSFNDLNLLRGEMQHRRTAAGAIEGQLKDGVLKAAEGILVKKDPFGIPDPKGLENMQAFRVYYLTTYDEERKKGVSVQELTDPLSPKYLGKAIPNYARTTNEILKDMSGRYKKESQNQAPTTAIIPAENKRKEGESIQAWKKRTGKGN